MFQWNGIRTVLLDMDGTLLDLHFDSHFWKKVVPRRYAATRGLDVVTAERILSPIFSRTAGSLDWYCVDYWSRTLSLDIMGMKRATSHLISIKPDTIQFLRFLSNRGLSTALVTNAHPKSLDLKLQHTALDEYLDAIISAHTLGFSKEQDEFWPRLQQQFRFEPESTLLVDDNLAALRTARAFGIAHLLAIKQPSSQDPVVDTAEFSAIHRFDELLPSVSENGAG